MNNKPAVQTDSLESRAQAFVDAYDRVTSDPAISKAIAKKMMEAFLAWAVMKMGQKRRQYMEEACRDFGVLCALRVLATGQKIEAVADEVPFELPLKLTKKRTGLTELLPQLHAIAAEYEMVCGVVKLEKAKARTGAQFRINLVARLERFAEEQELQPALTQDRLVRLVKDCHLRTPPSEIAAHYVGNRWGTSGANVKKLILLVDPKRMQEALGKYLKRAYLPADFEAIKQSLT